MYHLLLNIMFMSLFFIIDMTMLAQAKTLIVLTFSEKLSEILVCYVITQLGITFYVLRGKLIISKSS